MALHLILKKRITSTDVLYRLAFPTAKLHLLPPFEEGANWVDVQVRVRHGDELKTYVLRCVIRRRGPKRPVMERGWGKLVQDKGLKRGDQLLLYVDDDTGEFELQFLRRLGLFGVDIWYIIP